MLAVIDADNLAIAAAASAENDDVGIACLRADDMVNKTMEDTKSDKYELWLTGKGNFRYNVYPEYKANRRGLKRPKWEHQVKAHLEVMWAANRTTGCETDDMIGVRLCEEPDSIACHLDKDIDMIPGKHYGWELRRLGTIIKPAKIYYVNEDQAYTQFYWQLLVGDTTDNIKGVVGIGKKKAADILGPCTSEKEMYEVVKETYDCDEEFHMNAQVLWIWRKRNDNILERFEKLNQHLQKLREPVSNDTLEIPF